MPTAPANGSKRGPEAAHQAIAKFIESSKDPVLLEPGEKQFALSSDSLHIEFANGKLTLQAWDRDRNIVRRVLAVTEEKPGNLELEIERFGKRAGTLRLFDLAKPQNQSVFRKGSRLTFREQFRRSLSRQYPGWEIAELTSEADLQHSLSPSFPRALLRKGGAGLAAIGAPSGANADGVLTFGLIWLDYLLHRERRLRIESLSLILPLGQERTTCLRLRHLDRTGMNFTVFVYSEQGHEERADLKDYGNVDTRLSPRRTELHGDRAASQHDEWVARLLASGPVEAVERGDGTMSLRVRGLEFAVRTPDGLRFGLETKRAARASHLPEMEAIVREIARLRSAESPDRQNPIYSRNPELWMESQVRSSLEVLDASLRFHPVYGQVPAFAGVERGVIDLLACDTRGRLAVLELKAEEDVHLPLQALDYWIRVNWHLSRGEFLRHGYFAGIELRSEAPRLLLIAPSLNFHPTTETILGFFGDAIEIERIGLGMDWQQRLQVMFRLAGSSRPLYQRGTI